MKRISIYGDSDDLIEIESDVGTEEIGCYDTSVIFSFQTDGRGSFELEMWHDGKCGWTTILRFHDEREDGDEFPFTVGTEVSPTGYSWNVVVSSDKQFGVIATIDGKQVLYSTDVQLINLQDGDEQ